MVKEKTHMTIKVKEATFLHGEFLAKGEVVELSISDARSLMAANKAVEVEAVEEPDGVTWIKITEEVFGYDFQNGGVFDKDVVMLVLEVEAEILIADGLAKKATKKQITKAKKAE